MKRPPRSLRERIEEAQADELEHAPPSWFLYAVAVALVLIGIGFLVRGEPAGVAAILIGGAFGLFARAVRRDRGRHP